MTILTRSLIQVILVHFRFTFLSIYVPLATLVFAMEKATIEYACHALYTK